MICTFYSYKGGVGRSMALANVGDVLSRRGLKVLMIDFDLEAPGLEQFFYRSDERELRDAIRSQTGLLDLLLAYKESMSVAGGGDSFRDIERYIATVFGHRPGGGRLDLMPAGQRLSPAQMSHYALALRTFDWQDFYFNWEGDLFFEWLRRSLLPDRYDLVLIDSRTGVTEMGGICGYQLADVIVMMCGANHQNVDGTWSMLQDFRSQPVEDLRRGRPVEIVVVPARLEQRAPLLTEAFYERFDARFAALLPSRLAEVGLSFRDLTIPYDPQFAFEERVARSPEEKAAKEHLAQVFGTLADVITLLVPASSPGKTANSPIACAHRQATPRRLRRPRPHPSHRSMPNTTRPRSSPSTTCCSASPRTTARPPLRWSPPSRRKACASVPRRRREPSPGTGGCGCSTPSRTHGRSPCASVPGAAPTPSNGWSRKRCALTTQAACCRWQSC